MVLRDKCQFPIFCSKRRHVMALSIEVCDISSQLEWWYTLIRYWLSMFGCTLALSPINQDHCNLTNNVGGSQRCQPDPMEAALNDNHVMKLPFSNAQLNPSFISLFFSPGVRTDKEWGWKMNDSCNQWLSWYVMSCVV